MSTKFDRVFLVTLTLLGGLCPTALAIPSPTPAPQAAPAAKAFDTPQQAADAAVKAAADNDVPALQAIFGLEGKDIVPSGDPVQDKNDLARFAEKAKQKLEIQFDIGNPKRAVL